MKLLWTRLALEDLDSAREYITFRNPSAAAGIIKKIGEATKAVRAYPNLGRPGRVEDTRELVIAGTPFVVAYHVQEKQVEILAVIHAARRWPSSFSR